MQQESICPIILQFSLSKVPAITFARPMATSANASRNKKALLLPIMPTGDVWSQVCHKLSDPQEIQDNTIIPIEIRSRFKNHANQITMERREIRSNITISFNSEKTALLKAIDGLNLDPDLKNIKYIAEDSYENYKCTFYETGTYSTKIKTLYL